MPYNTVAQRIMKMRRKESSIASTTYPPQIDFAMKTNFVNTPNLKWHRLPILKTRCDETLPLARTSYGSKEHEVKEPTVPDENISPASCIELISSDMNSSIEASTPSTGAHTEIDTTVDSEFSLIWNSHDQGTKMPSGSLTMNSFSTKKSKDAISNKVNIFFGQECLTALLRTEYNVAMGIQNSVPMIPRLDAIEQDLDTLDRDFRDVVQKKNPVTSRRHVIKSTAFNITPQHSDGTLRHDSDKQGADPFHFPDEFMCALDKDETSEFISLFDEPSGEQETAVQVRIVSPESKKRQDCSFNSRYSEFMEYKEKLGNCDVSQEHPVDPVLGSKVRKRCSRNREHTSSPSTSPTTWKSHQESLKQVGFNFHLGGNHYSSLMFDRRCQELVEFKRKFGHCDHVPHEENPDLHKWCIQIKSALRQHAKGKKTRYHLTAERVSHLETIGFRWRDDANALTFDKRCRELIDYKKAFGHCDVPKRYKSNPSLGRWCGNLRTAYNKLQQGGKSTYNLTKERIERLEKIGFNWKVK